MALFIEGSDRYQPMQLPAAVDEYVSSASPVRAIDAFVDSLDLPALGLKTRNDSSEGRSSYHPGSLLKLCLWGWICCSEPSGQGKRHHSPEKGVECPNKPPGSHLSAPIPRQNSSQRPAP